MNKYIVTLTSIICITVLEVYALLNGFNGVTLAAACAVIAGLGGYTVNKAIEFRKIPTNKDPD